MKRLVILLLVLVSVLYFATSERFLTIPTSLKKYSAAKKAQKEDASVKIVSEESAIIDAIDKALPSVVTIGIKKTTRSSDVFEINPFDPLSPLRRTPGEEREIERNIGSGFAIASNLIITNKHVVSDTEAEYTILTNNGDTFKALEISRDPLNDLAIVKVDTKNLKPIELSDSSILKLGQRAIAIGTPLGEFTNTVTTGIVSGLGRGITAGSPYEGFVERLDNVIQTDAAINPGNSGGPLINLQGKVIGVNTAVSQSSENIGFAIPANVVRELLENFRSSGGKISRPFVGVRYQMISRQNAILNEIPEGAFIVDLLEGSPAEKAGLQAEDIIIEFDGKKVKGTDNNTLQKLIAQKKVGDKVNLKIWRDGKTLEKTLLLEIFNTSGE